MFSSILDYSTGKEPGEVQRQARSEFPKAVVQSRLCLRKPSTAIPRNGRHFIIGVAIYSRDELRLLDELNDSLRDSEQKADIKVFDVLQCSRIEDFEKFIPGIDEVFRTPVIGVIVDGRLVDQATGLPDVETTLRRFNVLAQRQHV